MENHHNLASELPEYKELIHSLKASNAHFAKLLDAYNELDEQVNRIDLDIETPSDAYWEDIKKQRLTLKDQLLALLIEAKQAA